MSTCQYILPVYERFEVHSDGAVSLRWSKWVKRLENLFVALGINYKKRKRALLLHYAGNDVQDIFETLENTGDDFDTANKKLTEFFILKRTLVHVQSYYSRMLENKTRPNSLTNKVIQDYNWKIL